MKKIYSIVAIILSSSYFVTIYIFLLKYPKYQNLIASNSIYPFIQSCFDAFFLWLILYYVAFPIERGMGKYIKHLTSKTENKIDDLVVKHLFKFIRVFKYLFLVFIWLKVIIFPDYVDIIITSWFDILFLLLWLVFVTSLINALFTQVLWKTEYFNEWLAKQLFPLLNKITIIIIWIIWVISIVSNLWYNVSALVTWAWIWWLAVALAAQKSLSNIFWALTIIINRPFQIWDFICIWNVKWTVKDIWLTYLTLQEMWGHKIILPNEKVLSSWIENLSDRENRRVDFTIWLRYDVSKNNLEKWKTIIENSLEKFVLEKTIQSYRVNFTTFWDYALNLSVTYFSLIFPFAEYLRQKHDINLEIKNEFEDAWIGIAFPTQELILQQESIKKKSSSKK